MAKLEEEMREMATNGQGEQRGVEDLHCPRGSEEAEGTAGEAGERDEGDDDKGMREQGAL